MYNAKQELVKINFSGKAPLVIDSAGISKNTYSTLEGTLYNLGNTLFTSINPEYKEPGIIKKKGALFSFLYKKPKEDKKK